jgi:glycosyltransferase involved in cell wall biosynthesis
MKIAFVSYSDFNGGAAKACYKIFNLLKKKNRSLLIVREKSINDKSIILFGNKYLNKLRNVFMHYLSRVIGLKDFSFNLLSSNMGTYLNSLDVDLINLHWINGETISINEIGKINKPLVITLHDMWFFSGGYHYVNENEYFKKKKRFLDEFIYNKKKKIFKNKKIYFISPSKWMNNCLKKNIFLQKKKSVIIPYPTENTFRPLDINKCRDKFKFKRDEVLCVFSAASLLDHERKGFDLLLESLKLINNFKFKVIVISKSKIFDHNKHEMIYFHNYKNNNKIYNELLNCANFFVIPSRQDNLPNVALEALSCGKPIVSYNIGGLGELVDHKNNGYLAKSFDVKDFARGINFMIKNHKKLNSNIIRNKFMKKINQNFVENKYNNFFKKILN